MCVSRNFMFKIPVSISVHYSNVLIFPLLRQDVLMAVNMKVVVCGLWCYSLAVSVLILCVCLCNPKIVCICASYVLCFQLHPVCSVLVDCTYECACMHPCTRACKQWAESITLGFCILMTIQLHHLVWNCNITDNVKGMAPSRYFLVLRI